MSENYSLTSSLGEKIAITTYGNEHISHNKCIVLVHGFKGFKDWGYAPYFGDFFASNGYFVITFNFSHNGIGENKFEFTELEKFANNTFTREISELEDVVNAYNNNYFGKVSEPKIGLVGHSRGGAIALLTASKIENIKAISTWGSVSTFDRYSKRQKDIWRKKGYFSVMNMRTKQEMKLNIEKAVNNLKKPLLIIHGKEDLAVKIGEAEEIFSWSDKNISNLILIENTGHTFGCVHPFEGTNAKFEEVLSHTNEFFTKNIN